MVGAADGVIVELVATIIVLLPYDPNVGVDGGIAYAALKPKSKTTSVRRKQDIALLEENCNRILLRKRESRLGLGCKIDAI